MKTLVSMFALAVALAFTGPAFAEDVSKATDQASCDKAGGVWNSQSNECAEGSAKMGEEEGTHQHHDQPASASKVLLGADSKANGNQNHGPAKNPMREKDDV